MIHLLLLAALTASPPTRLAKCDSGKTGKIELFVQRGDDGGWQLTSRDPAGTRALTGKVTSAAHKKLDKRHHAYRFELADGAFTQAAGLDDAHCKPSGDKSQCAVSAIEVRLARYGAKEPGDDGMDLFQGTDALVQDNGAPSGCVVYASKALKALLASSTH